MLSVIDSWLFQRENALQWYPVHPIIMTDQPHDGKTLVILCNVCYAMYSYTGCRLQYTHICLHWAWTTFNVDIIVFQRSESEAMLIPKFGIVENETARANVCVIAITRTWRALGKKTPIRSKKRLRRGEFKEFKECIRGIHQRLICIEICVSSYCGGSVVCECLRSSCLSWTLQNQAKVASVMVEFSLRAIHLVASIELSTKIV